MSADLAVRSLTEIRDMIAKRKKTYSDIGVMAEDMSLMQLHKDFSPMTPQQIADLEADPLSASVEQFILYNMMMGERLMVSADAERQDRRRKHIQSLTKYTDLSTHHMNLGVAADVLDGTRKVNSVCIHTTDAHTDKPKAIRLYKWALLLIDDELTSIYQTAVALNNGTIGKDIAKEW